MSNNRLVLLFLSAIILFGNSCEKEQKWPTLSDKEHSGFGYAAYLFRKNAEVMFVVENERDEVKTLILRCKCVYEYDSESCSVTLEDEIIPVIIPNPGQWSMVPIELKLKKGINYIVVKGGASMKGDILIDYLEIE